MSDTYQFEMSSMSQSVDEPFKNKQWNYVNDNNNGNYGSNSVSFDLSGLYNSQKFVIPNEMVLVIPLVAVLSQDNVAGLAGVNDFALGMKSGFYNCISSMLIDYDTKTVQQQTNNLNYFVSFKVNSSFSQDDINANSSTLGVFPDTATSWSYKTGAQNAVGNGMCNNNAVCAFPTLTNAYQGEIGNYGLLSRQLTTSYNINGANGVNALRSTNNLTSELRSYTNRVSAGATTDYQVYYITAQVRMKDLSSFFENCPMTRGFYARITLNMNLGSFAITKNNGAQTWALAGNNINFPNGTCPLMISPLAVGTVVNGACTQVVGGLYIGKVTSSLGTVNQSTLNVPSHPLPSCRIYCPMVDLHPEKALKYISENRNKLIVYSDIYPAVITNVGASSSFNYNVTNGLSGIQGILCIPFIASTVNGICTAQASPFSPCVSPFASEPSTTSPLGITQFNVLVGGENALALSLNYNFENFIQQLSSVNSINGGASTGLNSGLIDQIGFENIYKYYFVDLSRRSEDDISPKSITLVGQNNNLVAMDIYVYVIYRRSAIIDVETGKLRLENL